MIKFDLQRLAIFQLVHGLCARLSFGELYYMQIILDAFQAIKHVGIIYAQPSSFNLFFILWLMRWHN